jgi:hypothetical protein
MINKDRFPIIEFNAPKAFFLRQNVSLVDHDERFRPFQGGQGLAIAGLLNTQKPTDQDLKALYGFFKDSAQPIFMTFVRAYAAQLKPQFTDSIKDRLFLEKIMVQEDFTQATIDRLKQVADETNSGVAFLEYLKKRIAFYFARHSIFFKDDKEKVEIEQLLLEAPQRFPENKAEFSFHLAGFYYFHYETAKAFGEYFRVVKNLDTDPSPKAKNKAKEALLLAADLGVKDKNFEAIQAIKNMARQYFPGDQKLLMDIEQKKRGLIN